ncbi:hypothetical protein, partial [Bradyrhizobium sp. HKCCYLRH3061]|uniref:hypothetical protein n=1 Tax=Bradyrhizobium sp. HKCCYLRH3061 TaxID=3420734 RepID=UPI003EC143D1
MAQNEEAASVAFEGLSDLSEKHEDLVYLTQIKTTLRKESLQDAIEEALAVDEFLEQCCPSVRNSFRFRITARSLRGTVSSLPARLTASELKLDAASAKRWEHLRDRCLPVKVDGAPEVRLATRLWHDVTHPTTLIDTCMGRLLQMLPSGESPVQIATALLTLWNTARREKVAPLHLLGATDLKKDHGLVQGHIVHGVRPSPADVRDGCFMDRPEKLKAALSMIHERWLADARGRNAVIPVFWITGPSGAGKSVLLLQIISELLADGQVEAVNFIESYAHALPRALDNASATSLSMLVAGDDLYSPENRDPAIWREVGELTATARKFPSRFAILTCGPLEQLKAFRRECERHRVLDPVEIAAEPLNPEEQIAYHDWYQQRTGVDVPLRKEPIFVAAAWIYELQREQRLTPEAFATRFDNRLHELAIRAQGRAALVLNLYGLKAPEALFQGHRAELTQLVGERIWRLSNPTSGTLSGRFFHPQISRLIYDVLVPSGETVRRAEDVSVAFDAMLEEGGPADAFLGWLGTRKIGKSRSRGALMLDETMRVEVLKALWPCFRRRGPGHEITPRLFAWQQSALSAEIDLHASGIKARIEAWWRDLGEDAAGWGILFQMVWDMAGQEERQVLLSRGRSWLRAHLDAGAWPWINSRLIRFSPADAVIRDLALAWLSCNAAHQYCARVWLDLFETTQSSHQPTLEQDALVRLALQAIPAQPETSADIPMWTKTATLNPPINEFVDAVARKLTIIRNPHKHEKGVDFLLSLVPATELIARISPALRDSMEGFGWPYLWINVAIRCPREAGWLSRGRDWLMGRDNGPEWNYVWQKLIDQNFEHATLLPRGR